MIRIIDRYLFWQLLGGVMLVLLTLTALDAFFSYINELDDVGQGSYGHLEALLVIFFSIPERMYQYAPTSVLIGGLLSLGSLAAQGELTAMRAAGISVLGITMATLKAGVVFVLVIFLLGEWIAPAASQKSERLRTGSVSDNQALKSESGLWMKHDGKFIRTRGIVNNSHLLDVEVFEFDGSRLKSVVQAGNAQKNANGWQLNNIRKLQLGKDHISIESADSEQWGELVDNKMFTVLKLTPDSMAIKHLNEYISYLRDNHLDSAQYRLAFWNRFMQPLSCLVMLVLALPFVFGSQRTGGAGQKLFIGTLLGIGYYLVSRLLNQLGVVYGLPPFLSAVLPPAIFLSAGIVMLRRV
ncbi:MAG TPA: LPS export ABC transporter permease LptG [Gammaproteobacteria bacterium]|nr:LPS export ABC transporter permease LptG [Gammaproteobacteria bacterium]